MNKITSWDKTVRIDRFGVAYELTEAECAKYYPDGNGPKGRLNLWPEGAPDPSEVPHVNERCQNKNGTKFGEVRSAPYRGAGDAAFMQVMWDGHITTTSVPARIVTRIPDAPTVKIGEKTYNLDDAIARCEPLEEI